MMMKSLAASAALCLLATASNAAIVSVNGGPSNLGAAPAIVAAPAFALDDNVTNLGQQGFDEKQGVTLLADLNWDFGTIAKGTRVDSHMIFFNTEGNTRGNHFQVEWTFSGNIIGVMSNGNGSHEVASTPVLGSPTTTYPLAPFTARGLEGGRNASCGNSDGYTFAANVLCLSMTVTEPGDWIRVVTVSDVPVPASLPLIGTALAGLAWFGRRRRRS